MVSVLSILLYRLFFQLLIKFKKVLRIENIHVWVFLDLSKAFDTVNHNILLQKIEPYGIRGVVLKWFQSYLENGKQFVSIGNVRSAISYISCGVPQGSVLGPLLFLLYINDIQESNDLLDFYLFSDDSILFYSAKSLSE